ncbi:MAG: 1-acyl-sn-glycerol-3-phosphate acyltransferase [Myxococcota bacterium]
MRTEDRDKILTELKSRIVESALVRREHGAASLAEMLAESIYFEDKRLRDEHDGRARDADRTFWSGIRRELAQANDKKLAHLLGQAVDHYGSEICGHFNEQVYKVATRALPTGLNLLLNAVSPKRLLHSGPHLGGLEQSIVIQGETEHLRRLHELGTVLLCPTHVSNLDSLVIGFALHRLGLPPFSYGAGLNLFGNPLLAFFMHNLGAYTVDRRKMDPLYKEALKTYVTLSLEMGYDNLFFPGGTRSRSGGVERHLKLGLLGASIPAYVNNLVRGAKRPKVFVVPATLSMQLVLEAETLIDDFLQEVGKSRYIISDDEFSKPKRIFDFFVQLFGLDSRIFFTLGRGFDVFGNPVDDDGQSLDPRGRAVDPMRYVLVDGTPRALAQRDAEYTRELGEALAHSFMCDNVLQATHVLAFALLQMLRRDNPTLDVVRLLRAGGKRDDVELLALYREVDGLLERLGLLAQSGRLRLSPDLQATAADEVVADGLKHFATYHTKAAATRRGDRVFADDRALLYYYANRVDGYELGRAP